MAVVLQICAAAALLSAQETPLQIPLGIGKLDQVVDSVDGIVVIEKYEISVWYAHMRYISRKLTDVILRAPFQFGYCRDR